METTDCDTNRACDRVLARRGVSPEVSGEEPRRLQLSRAAGLNSPICGSIPLPLTNLRPPSREVLENVERSRLQASAHVFWPSQQSVSRSQPANGHWPVPKP